MAGLGLEGRYQECPQARILDGVAGISAPEQPTCASWARIGRPAGPPGGGRGGPEAQAAGTREPRPSVQDHSLDTLGKEVQRLSRLEALLRKKDEELSALQEEKEALKKQLKFLLQSRSREILVCRGPG